MNENYFVSDTLREGFSDKDSFKELLKDRILTDYLNIFLSLPVFSIRFIFKKNIETFVSATDEPILNNYSVTDEQVREWIRENRGDLFLQTPLCNEYRLASMLFKLPITLKIDLLGNEDENIERLKLKCFGTAVAMQHFKNYLSGTIGEHTVLFWLDVERYRHHTSMSCKQFMKDIELKYLVDGAKFELNLSLQKNIKHFLAQIRADRDKKGKCIDKKTLLGVQTMIVESLQSYWIPQYLNHRVKRLMIANCRWKRIFKHTDIKDKSSIVNLVKMLKGQQDEQRYIKEDLEEMKNNSRDSEYNSQNSNLPKLSMKDGKTHSNPDDFKSMDLNIFEKFKKENDPNMEHFNLPCKAIIKNLPKNELDLPINTIVNEKDATKHSKKHNSSEISKEKELSPILEKEKAEDSMKENSSVFQEFLSALTTDSIAGQPMLRYFKETNNNQAESNLMFWTKTREVLTDHLKDPSISIQEQLDNLIKIFFSKSADYEPSLPRNSKKELCRLLSSGMGIENLIDATEFVAKELFSDWKLFTEYDTQKLLKDLVGSAEVQTSTIQKIVQMPKRNYKRVWKSIQLAISICNRQYTDFVKKNPENDNKIENESSSDDTEESSDSEYEDNFSPFHNSTTEFVYSNSIRRQSRSRRPSVSVRSRNHQSSRQGRRRQSSIDKKQSLIDKKQSLIDKKQSLIDKKVLEKQKSPKIISNEKGKSDTVYPKSFQDIFKDPTKYEHFKNFLLKEKAEAGLLFSAALEARIQRSRINQQDLIIRRFVHSKPIQKGTRAFIENATKRPMRAGRATNLKALEERWYAKYLASFSPNAFPFLPNLMKSHSMKEKNRHLWKMFANSLIRFLRVIKQPELLEKFMNFLKMEHRLNFEKANAENNLDCGLPPRVSIHNNVQIHTERLVNDVNFLIEVMKYKDFFDALTVTEISKDTNVGKDQLLIINKSKTIVECFIDSQIPPPIQINISKSQAEKVRLFVRKGMITRGLFHELSLSVLSLLMFYWKKYCFYRESAYKRKPLTRKCINRSAYVIAAQETLIKGKVKRTVITEIEEDCSSKLMFSIQLGLRLGMPKSLFKRKSVTVQELVNNDEANVSAET